MNKPYKKQHIYTFVLGRRNMGVLICAIAAIMLGVMCAYPISQNQSTIYTGFLKLCSSHLLGTSTPKSANTLSYIGADVIMRQASPIFAPSEKTVSVFSPKRADMSDIIEAEKEVESEKKPPDNSGGPKEKAVVSQNLKLSNATDYEIDAHALAAAQRSYNALGSEPKVLVMHTHGCETYTGKNGAGLGSAGTYRSTDNENNVVHIGELLTEELKQRGINAIHDKTLCDYPSYNSAYKTAMGLNDWYINKYPSIEFVFDIHRDAIAEDDGTPVKLTAEIDGQKCAQAMIVCGTDKLGLPHPYWKDNLILALKIQKYLEDKYPGFMRPVNLREERFNMHQTKGSLIFEIGTHGNTMPEAEMSIKYLAEGIASVIGN